MSPDGMILVHRELVLTSKGSCVHVGVSVAMLYKHGGCAHVGVYVVMLYKERGLV